MNDDIKNIERLLEEARVILKDRDEKIAKGAGFNVFRLCGVNHYEVWHSKILADFLNPQGSHGQGARFLNRFCEILERLGFKGCFTKDAFVTTEFSGYIKNESIGRFDVLIEDVSKKSICIIENKIFACEQPEQLERYANWMEKERKGWNVILVFLTLSGRMASTIKRQNRYRRLAYVSRNQEPGLVDWIDSCVKDIDGVDKPFLNAALAQYRNLIIDLATGEQAMNEAVDKILKGKMECARIIYDNYSHVKLTIEQKLFSEIGEQLSLQATDWEINPDSDVWNRLDDETLNKKGGQKLARGWGWRLHEEKKHKREIWLSVFLGDGECEVGIFKPDFVVAGDKFERWCTRNMDMLVEDKWKLEGGNFPLWRYVSDNDCPNDGISWNDLFYDKIETDPQYRKTVKEAIVSNVLLLRDVMKKFISDNP